MVAPINQGLLNQIANPGAQGFAQLNQSLQNRNARNDRNKLQQLQTMSQFGPIAAGIVDQALSTPDLAQRDQIMEQNRKLFEGIGIQFDDKPLTFDDQSLSTLRKGLSAFVPQQQPKETPFIQNLRSLGIDPQSDEARTLFETSQKKGTNISIGDKQQTKGRNKVDETFAGTVVEWKAEGGFADVQKNLGQLAKVVKDFETGKSGTGAARNLVPDAVKAFTDPELLSSKQQVEEVVQRNLRVILGAQFTEKEGTRLIERAFNPNLSTKENTRRVKVLMRQIRNAARAKNEAVKYFDKHGTLTGFEGKTFSAADFAPEAMFKESESGRFTIEVVD